MNEVKEYIRTVLKKTHNFAYKIYEREPNPIDMKRKIFVEIVTKLREIEDRRDFMEDEIGMDMSTYEDKFFEVIENLFKLSFNKPQLALIQLYMYQLVPDKEWDGTLEVKLAGVLEVVDFKTPEQVWNVITKIPSKE